MIRLLIIISTVLAMSVTVFAKGLQQDMDALLKGRYSADAPGAAILIAQDDKVLYEYYGGVADFDTMSPITPDTRFNIASISKQFTVASILLMQERGMLNVQDLLLKYLPYLDSKVFGGITLQHIMSHSSGIPDERPRNNREWVLRATDHESISYLKNVKSLHFAPGTQYEYINPTFQILYRVIEQLSGEDFVHFQQHNIFSPVGMDNTYYFDARYDRDNTAHGYIVEGAEAPDNRDTSTPVLASGRKTFVDAKGTHWIEYDYGEETFFATKADGGIYSTPRDLLKWHLALERNSILNAESKALAFTPLTKVSGSTFSNYQNRPNTWYGLGQFIDTSIADCPRIYHTGDNGGFQAYLGLFPTKNISVIILENQYEYDRWELVQAIDNILKTNGLL